MQDTAIIDLYFARNEQAIAETQAAYGSYCRSIAWNVLHDSEDADECVNDTWLRAWNSIPPTRPARLSVYLGTITRNLSLDRWKSKRTARRGNGEMTVVLDEIAEVVPDTSSVEDAVETARLEELINRFLHGLPEKDCSVFLRRYWYMEEYGDIAKRYHMNLNTVKSSIHRTRGKLREFLKKEGVTI